MQVFDEITTTEPHKPLVEPLQRSGGRNNHGELTSWWRGGGHKRNYRVIDFKRDKRDIPAKVVDDRVRPEPLGADRAADLCRRREALHPAAGRPEGGRHDRGRRQRRHPAGQRAAAEEHPARHAWCTTWSCKPGKGGQIARSAGLGACRWWPRKASYASVKMPSGEIRKINIECLATIGQVGNLDHENVSIGKAGRSRWLGKRPHVRGVAMNPVDHPLGGGEGKTSGGRHPVSPWGHADQGLQDAQPQVDRSLHRAAAKEVVSVSHVELN